MFPLHSPNQLIYTHTQTTAGCIFRNNFLLDISFGMPPLQTATVLIHLLSFFTFLFCEFFNYPIEIGIFVFQILYFCPQSLDGFIVPFPFESRKGLFRAAGALRHIPRKNYRPTVWDKHLFAVLGVYVVAFQLGLFLSSLIFSRWKFRSSRIAP